MKNKNNALDCAFDMLLDEAVQQVGMQEAQIHGEKAAEEPQVSFSNAHTQKMKAVFRKEKRKLQLKKAMVYTKRVACIFLAVALISGITIGSVEAWRSKFLNFLFDKDQPNTDYNFTFPKGVTYSDDDINLGYVPANFELTRKQNTRKTFFYKFDNDSSYFTVKISNIADSMNIDTENATVTEIEINGYDGVYISNSNIDAIIFSDGNFSIQIAGNIGWEETIHIAKELKILKTL